jgi:hypothetical protein
MIGFCRFWRGNFFRGVGRQLEKKKKEKGRKKEERGEKKERKEKRKLITYYYIFIVSRYICTYFGERD